MTKKADFNAEEWSLVLEGPPIAGMLVITAQRGGTLRETVSMAKAYTEARQQAGASELLDEIVSASPEMDRNRFRSQEEFREGGPRRIREAVDLLEGKATPDEVDAYRKFVLDLTERVAAAHKEGGFLGIGGEEVSDAERKALDEVAAALGTSREGTSAGQDSGAQDTQGTE
jgi:hypothetical protein